MNKGALICLDANAKHVFWGTHDVQGSNPGLTCLTFQQLKKTYRQLKPWKCVLKIVVNIIYVYTNLQGFMFPALLGRV